MILLFFSAAAGNEDGRASVFIDVKTLEEIKLEIERATERRAELLHVLAEGHDAAVAAEHAQVEEEIARLWDEYRATRVQSASATATRSSSAPDSKSASSAPPNHVSPDPLRGSRHGSPALTSAGLPQRR